MSKRTGVLAFFLLAFVFLVVNRAAYKGYFQDDELDTMGWAQTGSADYYLIEALSPRFSTINFRPTAHFYFHEAVLHFGLDFPKYVLIVHLVHLFNVWLIWLLARKLGAQPAAAALACCFFAFHMALFDAVWKPMYIYDVLCATFCLLSILCFARRWWIASFCCYWLAYKSKELAVMLPLVLTAYELWFGKKRWKPLVPFFVASLSFGVQGLLFNPNKNNEYTFRFTFDALRRSSLFYAGRILLIPYLGFVVPLAAWLARNRRTWFGLILMGSMLLPLLFLPGRLLSAYCYAPFTGLAIVLAGVVETTGPIPIAILLLLWAPIDLRELRAERRVTLARDDEVRHWMDGLRQFAATKPTIDGISWAGRIPGFADWGVSGAVGLVFPYIPLKVHHFDGPEVPEFLQLNRVAYLVWDRRRLSSAIRVREEPDRSLIRMDDADGLWQLDGGWNDVDGDHRWSGPRSEAHLARPEGASQFTLRLIVPWPQITKVGAVTVNVKMNGVDLAPKRFDHGGDVEAEWDLPSAPAGPAQIALEAEPLYQPGANALGVAVRGLGFVTK